MKNINFERKHYGNRRQKMYRICRSTYSKSAVPGGGGAAALVGAIGTALAGMVGNLTTGKKKYAEFEDHIKGVHEKSAHLQDQLLEAIDKDTEAFNVVSAVFDLPKETEEEKLLVVKPCNKP